nr:MULTISPECIES: hypothetical protein [Mycobacterium]
MRLPLRPARLTTWLAAVGLAATVLTGCGTGQIAQTAAQEPAVNGNRVTIGNLALRNIRIQATQTGDFLQPGRSVELAFVAVNNSADVDDRLTGISSDIGPVALSGDAKLPAGRMLFVGSPEGQAAAPGPPGPNGAAKATVNLTKPISNGLTYKFTFKFEKAGEGSVEVPLAASSEQPREQGANHS